MSQRVSGAEAKNNTGQEMQAPRTFDRQRWSPHIAALLLSLPLATSGSAKFSPDGGMLVVEAAASAELGKDVVNISSEAAPRPSRHG
jgi:hypothetical protein